MLLTVSEVADRLRVSRRTVYMLMDSGRLRSAKIGNARRIRADWLEAYIAGAEILERGVLHVRATKTKRDRVVPLTERAKEIFHRRKDRTETAVLT